MAYAGTQHQTACELQTTLVTCCKDLATKAFDRAQCVRAWCELERLKREMRGIPPLAPHKVSELLRDARGATAPALSEPHEFEPQIVEPAKESITPEPVTAPPTLEPPSKKG